MRKQIRSTVVVAVVATLLATLTFAVGAGSANAAVNGATRSPFGYCGTLKATEYPTRSKKPKRVKVIVSLVAPDQGGDGTSCKRARSTLRAFYKQRRSSHVGPQRAGVVGRAVCSWPDPASTAPYGNTRFARDTGPLMTQCYAPRDGAAVGYAYRIPSVRKALPSCRAKTIAKVAKRFKFSGDRTMVGHVCWGRFVVVHVSNPCCGGTILLEHTGRRWRGVHLGSEQTPDTVNRKLRSARMTMPVIVSQLLARTLYRSNRPENVRL